MLVHHWSHPTTPAGPGWDIVISGAVELLTEHGFIARAELAEAETISVVVDDPDGTMDFKVGHRWYMVETLTAGAQLVWNGYIGDQHILRGDVGEAIFPTGTGRRWHLDVVQENTLASFRAIQGLAIAADGKRPAENADVRLTWLLGSPFLATVIDHGLIDWTGLATFAMDANDYRHQTAADVLRDISLVSGYNHYLRYRDASADIELAFYNPNTSTLDTSSLRISNDNADLDPTGNFASNSTWPPTLEATLDRKGDRVAAGIDLVYAGGSVYGVRLSTSYEFGMIDKVVQAPSIKTLPKANALLTRLLSQHSTQDERMTNVRITVPAANVNDVKHGQRLEVKFVHEPGWEDWRWARAIFKTFGRPDNEGQLVYPIDLELSPQTVECPEPTAAGYYPPLGGPGPLGGSIANDTPADGVTEYFKAGEFIYQPPNNAAGHAHNVWHFPTYSMADVGSPAGFSDWAPINLGNAIYLYLTGDGTLEILTREATANPSWMDISQVDADPLSLPPGSSWDSVGTYLATGATAESVVLDIHALHSEFPCSHLIRIDVSGDTVPGGRRYRGINWTPAP